MTLSYIIYTHMSYSNFPQGTPPGHRTVPVGALRFCIRVSWMAPLASEMARHVDTFLGAVSCSFIFRKNAWHCAAPAHNHAAPNWPCS